MIARCFQALLVTGVCLVFVVCFCGFDVFAFDFQSFDFNAFACVWVGLHFAFICSAQLLFLMLKGLAGQESVLLAFLHVVGAALAAAVGSGVSDSAFLTVLGSASDCFSPNRSL